MKKLALILLILCKIGINSYSQIIWSPPSAKWTYEGQGQVISYIEIEYNKDSLVNEKLSMVLNKKLYTYNSQTNDIVITSLGKEITYENDSVIYLYFYNRFDTLYSFNTPIGNSWVLHCCQDDEGCNKNARVIVKDTGSIQINNLKLKLIAVEYVFDSLFGGPTYKVQDTIIERIGSTNLYLLPCDIIEQMIDANEGGKLRCYNDEQLGNYSNNFEKPCNYLTSLSTSQIHEIKIFPVPSTGYLNIEFKDNTEKVLRIMDISGTYLFNQTTNCQKCIIDLNSFQKGILFLEVISEEGLYYNKIIKT